MNRKIRVGIIGATGMVGQRMVQLLDGHPWFSVSVLAASKSSSGKTYEEAVKNRWSMKNPIPKNLRTMQVYDAQNIEKIAPQVDFIFCAVSMNKKDTKELEEKYAKNEIPVISNNSACRGMEDVPMIIPEVNYDHSQIINSQRKRLDTKRGFIAVKPNCSIQSYVPALTPLFDFEIKSINVCTYQAISGAGKTFETWPEMIDNVIPFIQGEDEKSEEEPLQIWGELVNKEAGYIVRKNENILINAQCIRVPVKDGHMAAVSVAFKKKPTLEDIKTRWEQFETMPQKLNLPSAPKPFLKYFEENDRPQTKIDRDYQSGMGVTIGRLRPDKIFDYKFICLSHNTLRGAAGGALLMAELLYKQGYITV